MLIFRSPLFTIRPIPVMLNRLVGSPDTETVWWKLLSTHCTPLHSKFLLFTSMHSKIFWCAHSWTSKICIAQSFTPKYLDCTPMHIKSGVHMVRARYMLWFGTQKSIQPAGGFTFSTASPYTGPKIGVGCLGHGWCRCETFWRGEVSQESCDEARLYWVPMIRTWLSLLALGAITEHRLRTVVAVV